MSPVIYGKTKKSKFVVKFQLLTLVKFQLWLNCHNWSSCLLHLPNLQWSMRSLIQSRSLRWKIAWFSLHCLLVKCQLHFSLVRVEYAYAYIVVIIILSYSEPILGDDVLTQTLTLTAEEIILINVNTSMTLCRQSRTDYMQLTPRVPLRWQTQASLEPRKRTSTFYYLFFFFKIKLRNDE